MLYGWDFNSAWHFIASSASLATLIGCGAVAIASMTPPVIAAFIPDLRKWALCVAVIAFSYTFVLGKGFNHGLSVKQAQWDAAVAQEAVNGERARTDAVDTIRTLPPDSVRNDPRNRDNWKRDRK